jgi:mRNA interferase RelE/StbE
MPAYRIEIKKSAVKEIKSLDKKVIPPIWEKIKTLSKNPRPPSSKKLTGSIKSYRLPVASYRILYQIDDSTKTITVYAVGHRKEIYR